MITEVYGTDNVVNYQQNVAAPPAPAPQHWLKLEPSEPRRRHFETPAPQNRCKTKENEALLLKERHFLQTNFKEAKFFLSYFLSKNNSYVKTLHQRNTGNKIRKTSDFSS
jgi:hypothetical protein